MTASKLYLMGMSGHALSVMEALRSCGMDVAGYFDKQPSVKVNFPYIGSEEEEDVWNRIPTDAQLFPAVGSNALRQNMIATIDRRGFSSINVVHQTAIVSNSAKLGGFVFVSMGALIQAKVMVGKGSIINTGAVVEHGCIVQPFSHIGPGTVLAGDVTVGEGSFIGANATVLPGISVGVNTIIGAGSVVVKNIPDNTVYAGNPARFLRKHD